MFWWDNNALHIPVTSISVMYACYIAVSYIHKGFSDYVIRA